MGGNGHYVHIVDDADLTRVSLAALLGSVGLNVRTFESGEAFLEGADGGHTSCIILDIRLPGMSGLDLLVHLRRSGQSSPRIVITGFADVPLVIKAFQAGAADFFPKPISDQMLLDRVQELIRLDDLRRLREAEIERHRSRFGTLTPREFEIMKLIALGDSTAQAASRLGLSEKTIESHRAKIMSKTSSRSFADLVRSAVLGQLIFADDH